jgi:hypothetical protein
MVHQNLGRHDEAIGTRIDFIVPCKETEGYFGVFLLKFVIFLIAERFDGTAIDCLLAPFDEILNGEFGWYRLSRSSMCRYENRGTMDDGFYTMLLKGAQRKRETGEFVL